MDISKVIGDNLRRLRTQQNFSLGKLSELSGVSKAQLSQMERGDSNPSIETIWKIARALHVTYTALLDRHETVRSVLRKENLIVQELNCCQGRMWCYYKSSENRNFELFTLQIQPCGTYISPGHGEHTQEYILVQKGNLELGAGQTVYMLGPSDAISFDPSEPHSYKNAGSTDLDIIMINYYQ